MIRRIRENCCKIILTKTQIYRIIPFKHSLQMTIKMFIFPWCRLKKQPSGIEIDKLNSRICEIVKRETILIIAA